MVSLIKAAKNYEFPALISLIVANNALASGIRLAENYNIPIKVFDKKVSKSFFVVKV